jgi:signal transduction histidine kinase
VDRRLLEPAATRQEHDQRVDVAIAATVGMVCVLFQFGALNGGWARGLLLTLVLSGALAWRRSRPIAAAAVVVVACLVELVVLRYEFLPANVAAPMTVYALAAYGPPWAGRAGLVVGVLGAALAAAVYVGSYSFDGLALASVALVVMGGIVVGSWGAGRRRRHAGTPDPDHPWAPAEPLLERTARRLREHPFGVDSTLAGLGVVGLVLAPASGYGPAGAAVLVGLLLVVPLAWRRRRPVRAASVVVAACLLELVVLPAEFLPANAAAPVVVYSLAAYAPRWASRTGLTLGLIGGLLAAATVFSSSSGADFLAATVGIGVLVVAAWALGDLRRARLQQMAGLEERARLLELEREQEMQLAASTERARIAREMHDVVAHSLSVVIAQADGGRYAGQADPEAATAALEQISSTGRQALAEMRKLLGVLREGDGQEFAPQPDVAAIDQLVADVRASGLDVDLVVEGAPQPMPAGPQLAAYRIVQESLTNVLKHAGPAGRAQVRLHWRPDGLELSIEDDGRGAAAIVEADGQGHGLLGMRERAQLHGGRLTAGPRTGGGFGVSALLPYRATR